MSELKVFVWGFSDYGNEANYKNFMTDYYSGLGVVIAASESDARDMITKAVGYIGNYGLEHSPVVYELEPLVFISTGK